MSDLEQRYRRLFAAYPAEHRREREDEMVGVLLDAAHPGQQKPTRREAVSIVGNGLLTRARGADEWRTGVRWAGVVSLAMAVAMAGLAVGVGVLPPVSGRIVATPGYFGEPLPSPAWLPVAFWAAGLGLALLVAVADGRRLRIGAAAAMVPLIVLGAAAGTEVAGFLRWYTVPFVAFLALSTASAGVPRRARVVAVAVGLVVAGWHLLRYLAKNTDVGWFGGRVQLWTVMSRWSLSFELTVLRPSHWWALVGLCLVAAGWRPAVAVAGGLLAMPLAVLAAGPSAGVGVTPGGQAALVVAVLAAVGLFLVVLVAGRFRGSRLATPGKR